MSYPYTVPVSFSFEVKIPGMSGDGECTFRDVGGLNVKLDVEKISEGGLNDYVHKFPKPAQYNELVLKRGLLKNSSLIQWVNNAIRNFKFEPTQVYISLLDEKGAPSVKWTVRNAYPIGIELSEFKAEENSIVIETLTLAYDFFVRTG
jgi:phage tail-like protein